MLKTMCVMRRPDLRQRTARTLGVAAALLLVGFPAFAQATDPISGVTDEVSSVYREFKTTAYLVSAICACIGAVKIFSKLAVGDPAFRGAVLGWFFAMMFCAVIPSILDGLYKPSGGISSSLTTVNTNLRGGWSKYASIMKILMALLTLIGTFRVYALWQTGQDMYQAVMYWAGALMFAGFVLFLIESGVFGTLG